MVPLFHLNGDGLYVRDTARFRINSSKENKESVDQSNIEQDFKCPNFGDTRFFFDTILVDFKLSRIRYSGVIFLYRQVWCLPNLHRKYGIGN